MFRPVILTILTILLINTGSTAQSRYPQDYFRNPLAIPILLAGNFGECRPGHFHSGIDIKTQGKENLPVFASAGGYISRIKMEPGGFGHGLYITHPNGYTTLYAHLNNFVPKLQAFVRRQQYAKQSWTVDLALQPDQFPVSKGQQIAFSGNTGGSTAPHLHFEIRDSKTEHPLNPQLFGFAINDTRPPLPVKLAVYDRNALFYNNPSDLYSLIQKNNSFALTTDTIIAYDHSGFGVEVNDFMNGSSNTLALYTAEWYVDDVLQGRIRLDDIGYDESRYLHAYADYGTRQSKKIWVQCLFQLPGNKLDRIYEDLNADRGYLIFPDNEAHAVRIELMDVPGNKTVINFWAKRGKPSGGIRPADLLDFEAVNTSPYSVVAFTIDKTHLYESVGYTKSATQKDLAYSNAYQIGLVEAPVHRYFDLKIQPGRPVPFDFRSKIVMVYSDGKNQDGRVASPIDKGWYKASVRNFGSYWLDVDTAGPSITTPTAWTENQRKASRLSFIIKDNATSVKTVRGELDGKWLLIEQHGSNWFYEMDEHCPKGKHELVLTATDENGNTTRKSYSFTR